MSGPALDPRTPVIIGVGQWTNRVDRGEPAVSPVELMVGSARRAADDAGAPGALRTLDVVRVVGLLSWRYRDPGRLVADELGSPAARSGLTAMGGNSPQALVSETSSQLQAGDLDLALVCGGEAWRTRKDHMRRDSRPPWTKQSDHAVPDERFGAEMTMSHEAETAIGLVAPTQAYPLVDHAIRIAAGRTVAEQQALIGAMWSRFSEVAAANPHAWKQTPLSPTDVAEPGPDNRLVGHPYTKAVNSYEWVDQGAALLMSTVARARSLGVPSDRWIFPIAGADAAEPPLSVREHLHRSVSMRAVGRSVLAGAGIGPDDLGIVDLYSCFPSAVQLAATEIGLAPEQDLTLTGGMSFFGGPWNDYVTHSVATTVERLRHDPEQFALCTANGGHTSKQSFGVYSGQPRYGGFVRETASPQAAVDRAETREVITDHVGPATLEAFTVMHDRRGEAETAFVSALTAAGARTWATSADRGVMEALMTGALDRARLHVDGTSFRPDG